jgi:Ca2+-binding EF-hand superfamily protein
MNMYTKTLITLATALLLSAPSIATAGSDLSSAPKWAAKADADGNGTISKEEWLADRGAEAKKNGRAVDEKKLTRRFGQIDSNADGEISADEINAYVADRKKNKK